MITRTSLSPEMSGNSPLSLKAEVMLLLFITIFGLIGLGLCIGFYTPSDELTSSYTEPTEMQISGIYDRQVKT